MTNGEEFSHSFSYRDAGVDVTAGYRAVQLIKKHVERTNTPGVLSNIGGFSGLFAPDISGMKEPVLVSGTDGVGTKIKIAMLMDKHDTIGIDAVAMCVNDVVCCGAKPLFFLDYIACGKNIPERIEKIVSGIAEGCVCAGCALIGGETAEHPGIMEPDDYDLAGFSVGISDRERLITGEGLESGDVLVGLRSSGLHSNGFSLVRKVFNVSSSNLGNYYGELGDSLGSTLLTPTRIYVRAVLAMAENAEVKAMSHITGGGFYENVPRMMRPGLTAKIEKKAIPEMPIFRLTQEMGKISEHDMYNTFNMGIGFILAVSKNTVQKAIDTAIAYGEEPVILGEVVAGEEGVELW